MDEEIKTNASVQVADASNPRYMLAENLLIYEDVYQLTLLIFRDVANFGAEYKLVLKEPLCSETTNLFKLILWANRSKAEKYSYLTNFLVRLESIKVYIRLAHDLKQISTGQQADLMERLIKVGKQAVALRNA